MKKNKKVKDILRKAEDAIKNDSIKKDIEQNGVIMKGPISLTPDEFIDMIENEDSDDDRPGITIIFYEEDTPISRRDEIEESLCDFMEENQIGEWNGSGSGDLGSGPMFDMNFVVEELQNSIELIKKKLKELKVGQKTEIILDDQTLKLFG